MIAADTSALVAYFAGQSGDDIAAVDRALSDGGLRLPPVVLTELLSDPRISALVASLLTQAPILHIDAGYWQRAGATRAAIRARGLKARTVDVLICQSCLDHDAPLITRDADFRHFAKHCGLKLA